MLKRRIQKVTAAIKKLLASGKAAKKFLLCKECDRIEVEVAADIGAVTCAYCVQRQVAPPDSIMPKEKSGFPRGWALRATYIHTDGRIFEKGQDTGRKHVPGTPESAPKKKSVRSKVKKVAKKVTKKAVNKKVVKKSDSKRKK
jgi:hypothetical protein